MRYRRAGRWTLNFEGDGASAFAHDPRGSFTEQTIFWAPEALPEVVPIVRTASGSEADGTTLVLADLASGSVRQAADGWHAVLRIDGAQHHLWLKEVPQLGESYAAELPLDTDYEIRAHASHRLWRAINGRPPGPPFHHLSAQRRERLALALRALDGHLDGASYRVIAEVLFGGKRIPERAWKTHELRSRTIRLVQAGLALMRGGYRALLRPLSRKE
jgi:hypothetical protein